jgi:hypothetical protein
MKSVAPDALGVELVRNSVVVSHRIMRAMRRGIEAGHLR